MFVIAPNHKEFENHGVSCICLHRCTVVEMVATIYKHLFVLTNSHLCFNVGLPEGLPPSFSFREEQYLVCYWSNIMIKSAVCCTKNRPAIQLCYPAVRCSRQVVSSFLLGRLGQVQLHANSMPMPTCKSMPMPHASSMPTCKQIRQQHSFRHVSDVFCSLFDGFT